MKFENISTQMNTNKLIAGIIAGAAVGVAIGYIVNPDKTLLKLNQFRKKGKDGKEDIKFKFNDVLGNISDAVEAAEDEKDELFATGKRKFHQVKREVKSALDDQSI
ncbi:hypothetical protein BH11BAC2_BH11BAC2_20060 [soil metagenome]